jgi:hypothetical protein
MFVDINYVISCDLYSVRYFFLSLFIHLSLLSVRVLWTMSWAWSRRNSLNCAVRILRIFLPLSTMNMELRATYDLFIYLFIYLFGLSSLGSLVGVSQYYQSTKESGPTVSIEQIITQSHSSMFLFLIPFCSVFVFFSLPPFRSCDCMFSPC